MPVANSLRKWLPIGWLALVALASCSDTAGPPISELAVDAGARGPEPSPHKHACTDPEDPNCLPGDADPNPGAPGYYIDVAGQSMSRAWCESNGNDSDHDGIADYCEDKLAFRFRPEMKSSAFDDVRGEPYYVVQPVFEDFYSPFDDGPVPIVDSTPIRIAYLLAYYEDFGDPSNQQNPSGHIGDSEFVLVDVYYDEEDFHWKLQASLGSAHYEGGATDGTEWASPQGLEFPDKLLGYPRWWVAENTHANWATRSRCNNGAFGADECPSPLAAWRVEVSSLWNIGSRDHPAPDVPFNSFGNDNT